MALVIRKLLQLLRPGSIFWIIIFFVWPVLCQAEENSYYICSHDKRRECKGCHPPHSNKSQQALWMPKNKHDPSNKYFILPKEEEVLCLGCHDGVIAEDIFPTLSPQLEDLSEVFFSDIKLYYSSEEILSFNSCEKHYYLVSYSRDLLPEGQLRCKTCHDIHNLKGSSKTDLTDRGYFRLKICHKCHTFKEQTR